MHAHRQKTAERHFKPGELESHTLVEGKNGTTRIAKPAAVLGAIAAPKSSVRATLFIRRQLWTSAPGRFIEQITKIGELQIWFRDGGDFRVDDLSAEIAKIAE